MTDPDFDPTVAAPEDLPPVSSEEAAEIVENDPALQRAGADADSDADSED